MNGAENALLPQHDEKTDELTTTSIDAEPTSADDAPPLKQEDAQDDARNEHFQGKKRKFADTPQGPRSSRAVSPPWKKVAVEGPTSFVEEGKRRSARTNVIPLELQPHSAQRRTRAAHQELSNSIKHKYGSNGVRKSTPTHSYGKHTRSSSKSGTLASTKSPAKFNNQAPGTTPSKRPYRKRASTLGDYSSPAVSKNETPTVKRRPGRPPKVKMEEQEVVTNGWHKSESDEDEDGDDAADSNDEDEAEESEEVSEEDEDMPLDPDFKPQRLKFKVKMPSLTAQHPSHIPAAKRFGSFREWVENDDPYEGGDLRTSSEHIRKEARARQQVVDAIQSGTLQSSISAFDQIEAEEGPSRQYFHHDHFLAHAQDMRRRMMAEKRRHIREAKKLAEDLKAYWQALQPKSEEDIIRERNEALEAKAQAVMRQCLYDLGLKWELIKAEVEKQRLVKWEQEQEALGKEALNKVLEQSTQLLDARMRRGSSEVGTDEENEAGSDADGSSDAGSEVSRSNSEDERNMSSSESEVQNQSAEEDMDADEDLTVEELRRKYKQVPSAHLNRPPEEDDQIDTDHMDLDTPGTRNAMSKVDPDVLLNDEAMNALADSSKRHDSQGIEGSHANDIDDAILDETDESTDMDDDMGSSDDESEDAGSSEEDDDNPRDLLGFFSKNEIAAVSKEEHTEQREVSSRAPGIIPKHESFQFDDEDDLDEISLIPDATEVQTPSASNDSSHKRVEEESELGFTHQPEFQPQPAAELEPINPTQEDPGSNVLVQQDRPSESIAKVESEVESLPAVNDDIEPTQMPQEDSDQEKQQPRPEQPIGSEEKDIESFTAPQISSPANETSEYTQSGVVDHDSAMDTNTDSLPTTPLSSKPLKTSVPSLLRGTLREYQHFGLDWLAGLYANGTNGILADEMGLGKTIQTISLLAHLAVEHHIWGPHLIVVPTSVMLNWEMEFKKFLPGFKVMTYYGNPEERKQKRKGWLSDDKWNVVITSYQLVLQDQVSFKKRGWHYLVLDEAHNIKNFRSQRWQTLLSFRTDARLLLTGTPLQNNLTELWSLMFFLMPSDSTETGIAGFAHLDEFSSWFKKPVEQILEQGRDTMDADAKNVVRRLHSVLRPYLLRRLKADVEKQMPGKYEHVVYCKLSKRQRYLYDGFMSRATTRETLASGNYMSIINCLMQLRKVCNHPDLFETRPIVTSFAMQKSAIADYEIKELLVRRKLLRESHEDKVSLDAVDLLPGSNGPISALDTLQSSRLKAITNIRWIMSDQNRLVQPKMAFNGSSVLATLSHMENNARQAARDDLHHKVYLTSLRSQRRPLMNYSLIDRVKLHLNPIDVSGKPVPRAQLTDTLMDRSDAVQAMILDLPSRSASLETTIQKFACVTPAVVAPDVGVKALAQTGVQLVEKSSRTLTKDPFHEARMRLSIAFPDKRLLQYDCGKLQRLDALLRTLQAGGHRALIFTQMTKVLDILEQFLNIHGHRYLRLDGSTKIEQRQILTDRFNNDPRILAFILSSRSGGLGINLTGADTVIFYDLDWNPAMDKQCQDRCHRIGQTRDVHIYRFVSEYTIEANILRKANQKRMLDDVIIQEGDFTTDFFHKPSPRDAFEDDAMHEADAEASAAMDRVLGAGSAPGKLGAKIFEQAEDKEDIAAAHVAEKEVQHADEADFSERTPAGGATPKSSVPQTPGGAPDTPRRAASPGVDDVAALELHRGVIMPRTDMAVDIFQDKDAIGVDRHIVEFLEWELKDVPVGPPPGERKRKKKGGEHVLKRKR
ncbi:MAG: swr1 complex component [Stictis urceolatum]|nr:swr1 complex component [Stictis urceolata]